MTWVLDLDGVVWLADVPLPGAAEAVARLRAAGERVVFATNNSGPPLADQEAKLARLGIPAAGDVLSSATAAARLVEPGERVLVCGGPGVVEAMAARGAEPVRDGDADVVAVGFHRDFDYERLRVAARAVRRGARLLGTNDDATYPTPDGPIPARARCWPRSPTRRGPRRWWRASPTRRWRTSCAPSAAPRGRWWATGPTPTACWPASSATGSRSCSPV